MARILMVGCGNMGGALLARWSDVLDHQFVVIDPALPDLPDTVIGYRDAQAVENGEFDALIVAVKPQLIEKAMPAIAPLLANGGVVISIAAGASAAMTRRASGDAPVVRLMPNLPAQIAMGVCGLFAQDDCTQAHKDLANALAEAVGTTLWLDNEDLIDRITAVAGSGPGYVYEFARTYQNAAQALGFSPEQSRMLVEETLRGAMELSRRDDRAFAELRSAITSEGGTTAAGLSALNGDGQLDVRLDDTLKAAYSRAIALRN